MLRHLLIPIDIHSDVTEDKRSAGIHILVNEWGVDEQEQSYIDVVCLKPHLNDLFSMIILDIFEELQQAEAEPDFVCRKVLNKWREFLRQTSSDLPPIEVLAGIFAELTFLRSISARNREAIQAWNGPIGGRHDFSAGNLAVEVKATLQHQGKLTLKIHGHDQLQAPPNSDLYLYVARVEKINRGGETFEQLIDDLGKLQVDIGKVQRLLASLGLFPDMITNVDFGFHLLEERLYLIDDGFPRITTDSFVGHTLPAKVIDLGYTIDLSTDEPMWLSPEKVEKLYGDFAQELR